jgi:hypothetical protein
MSRYPSSLRRSAGPLGALGRAVALGSAAALALSAAGATAATTHPKASWRITATPNRGIGPYGRFFVDVSAASAKNVWAVGFDSVSPLIAHWNGKRWKATPAPRPAGGTGRLISVSALKGTDAWAFGSQGSGCTATCLWALHHTAQGWQKARAGRFPDGFVAYRVTAYGDKDFWAVGEQTALGQAPVGAALHWNGSSWAKYTVSSVVGESTELLDIEPVPGKKAWIASGVDFDAVHGFTMYARWTPGSGFERMDNSGPANGGTAVSLVVSSARSAWSVGTQQASYNHPLIEHWDGSSWRVVKSPRLPYRQFSSGFASIASGARNRMLAVGSGTTRAGGTKLIAARYNGSRWQLVDAPNVKVGGEWQNQFNAVTSVPGSPRMYWAVGDHGNPSGQQYRADHTLAERCLC